MSRVFDELAQELMDRPQPVSVELQQTLRELEFLNRNFGGHGFTRRFLRGRFARGSSCEVLDLCTGGGDFPRAMVDWARTEGVSIRIDAVDANPAILHLANQFSGDYPEIAYHKGDVTCFKAAQTYDLVHCSLALHHFSVREAVALLRHARKLSRAYILFTDLERSFLTRISIFFVNRVLVHQRMTRKDGDTSAARAFSFAELPRLAEAAGWIDAGHQRFLFGRQALWLPT